MPIKKPLFIALAAMISVVGITPTPSAAATVRIGGTGAALAAMGIVGDHLPKPGMSVEVLPSLGTPGGIEALADGAIDVALAARPLKEAESAKGVREAACMVTPLVFATSHENPGSLRLAQLPEIYADPRAAWPDGSPIRIILRSRAGSENSYLARMVPGLGPVIEAAYARPGIPVGSTDQENADLAQRTVGSLTPTTLLQLRAEHMPLHVVPLDGIEPTTDTVGNGSYPLSFRICLLLSSTPSAEARAFVDHVVSERGVELLRGLGAAPEPVKAK